MKSPLARIRCDSGQAFVFIAFTLMVLVGMAALVIDGGSWYRADRHAQTAADAAALAGAQELPDRWDAEDSAKEYWSKNPDVSTSDDTLNFPDPAEPEYQITVKVTRKANGVFAKVLGIDSVTVGAQAQARVSVPLEMKNIAPIAIKDTAACFLSEPSCFDQTVTIDLDDSQISSSLDGWINLDCHSPSFGVCGDGGTGGGELKDWIDEGYTSALPANQWYGVKHGGTNGVKITLEANAGEILFIPVWDQESLDPPSFHIVGWAAFVIDSGGVDFQGQSKKHTGHIETFIATDLAGGGTIPDPDLDFGVHVITLTH
jgi:Flp pilus assembly protein TadG